MSKTQCRELYNFKELSPKAQEKVLEDNRDWNVDHDWWDYLYEDAKNIGLEITSFELSWSITGNLTMTATESIKKILEDHGDQCETYKTAAEYKVLFQSERVKRRGLGEEDWEEEDEDMVEDYKKALLKHYLKMLNEECDYLTSDECLRETFDDKDDLWFDEYGREV